MNSKKSNRRSSILRRDVDVEENAVETTRRKRVSFHNKMHIQTFCKEDGQIASTTPIMQRITETLDSDAMLTPGHGVSTLSHQTPKSSRTVDDANSYMDISCEQNTFALVHGGPLEPKQNDVHNETDAMDITQDGNKTEVLFRTIKREVTISETIQISAGKENVQNIGSTNETLPMDISLDQSRAQLETTADLFKNCLNTGRQQVPTSSDNNETIDMEMTLNVTKQTNHGNVTIDQNCTANLFKLPMRASNTDNNDTMAMELTMNATHLQQNQANASMDPNSTVNLFKSPSRVSKQSKLVPIADNDDDDDMNITQDAAADNMTMNLFKSPARSAAQPIVQLTKPISPFDDEEIAEEDDEMNKTENLFKSPARKRANRTIRLDHSMDISPARPISFHEIKEDSAADNTMDLIKSSAKAVNNKTVMQEVSMCISPAPEIENDDAMNISEADRTQQLFRSPARVKNDKTVMQESSMCISPAPEVDNDDVMNISKADGTQKLFPSPSRVDVSRTVDPQSSMSISPEPIQPIKQDENDMDVSVEERTEELIKSPARGTSILHSKSSTNPFVFSTSLTLSPAGIKRTLSGLKASNTHQQECEVSTRTAVEPSSHVSFVKRGNDSADATNMTIDLKKNETITADVGNDVSLRKDESIDMDMSDVEACPSSNNRTMNLSAVSCAMTALEATNLYESSAEDLVELGRRAKAVSANSHFEVLDANERSYMKNISMVNMSTALLNRSRKDVCRLNTSSPFSANNTMLQMSMNETNVSIQSALNFSFNRNDITEVVCLEHDPDDSEQTESLKAEARRRLTQKMEELANDATASIEELVPKLKAKFSDEKFDLIMREDVNKMSGIEKRIMFSRTTFAQTDILVTRKAVMTEIRDLTLEKIAEAEAGYYADEAARKEYQALMAELEKDNLKELSEFDDVTVEELMQVYKEKSELELATGEQKLEMLRNELEMKTKEIEDQEEMIRLAEQILQTLKTREEMVAERKRQLKLAFDGIMSTIGS